jgi:hypothetical protein
MTCNIETDKRFGGIAVQMDTNEDRHVIVVCRAGCSGRRETMTLELQDRMRRALADRAGLEDKDRRIQADDGS